MTIPTKTHLEKCPAVSQDIDQRNIYDCNNTTDKHVLIADSPSVSVTMPPRPLYSSRQRVCAVTLLGIFVLLSIGLLVVTFDGSGQRPASFHGFCAVPYDGQANMVEANMFMQAAISGDGNGFNMANMGIDSSDERAPWMNAPSHLFYEHFDLSGGAGDAADEGYTRVTVPTFREGRSGQFLHDFKYNQSLIIDKTEAHCFVMPLDRETVLKPRNMQDLIEKMMDGYYNIDTEQVRRKMRVVIPPLADTSEVAPRIMNECVGMEIFRLEPFVGRVFKRSIDELPDSAKYAHFSGNRIVTLDLVNYPQLKQFLANRK